MLIGRKEASDSQKLYELHYQLSASAYKVPIEYTFLRHHRAWQIDPCTIRNSGNKRQHYSFFHVETKIVFSPATQHRFASQINEMIGFNYHRADESL